jgi:hypothetical protein
MAIYIVAWSKRTHHDFNIGPVFTTLPDACQYFGLPEDVFFHVERDHVYQDGPRRSWGTYAQQWVHSDDNYNYHIFEREVTP